MTTIELFNKRYHDEVVGGYSADGFDLPFPLDMWYGSRVLFGRVDQQQNVVNLSQEAKKQKLKLIKPSNDYSTTMKGVLVLDFVANAFSAMQSNFRRAQAMNRLGEGGVIRNLKPKSGFVDPSILYNTFIEQVFTTFSDVYLGPVERSKQVLDFDSYMKMFLNFLEEYGSTMPVTRTYFTKTNFCSPLISGLMIELSAENFNNDIARSRWFQDPNFEFYVKTARKFGFLVDEHAPWRLVANLASPAMQKYWWKTRLTEPSKEELIAQIEEIIGTGCTDDQTIQNLETWANSPYGDPPGTPVFEKFLEPVTIESLFRTHYVRTSILDVDEIRINLVKFYNQFVEENPIVRIIDTENCAYGLTPDRKRLKILTREKITNKVVKEKYDMFYWIKLYFNIRLRERKQAKMSMAKQKRILKTAKIKLNRNGRKSSILYVDGALRGFPKRVQSLPTVTEFIEQVANISGNILVYGTTSENSGHTHKFEVDNDGNGWALETTHPQNQKVKHKHKVVNWIVQESQSECYPKCEDLYNIPGSGPHSHDIEPV